MIAFPGNCPYPDCNQRLVRELEGGEYGFCEACGRLAALCPQPDCSGLNRPFMSYCCRCGRAILDYGLPAARRVLRPARGTQDPSECLVADLRAWCHDAGELECRMTLVEGLIFSQFPNGWILGLHPFVPRAERRGPLAGWERSVVLAQRPAGPVNALLFPMQVVGSSLIVAGRQQVWHLPLASLWGVSWQSGLAGNAVGGVCGPTWKSVYRADSNWEIVGPPATAPPVLSGRREPALFVFLRRQGREDIERWAWVPLEIEGEEQKGYTGQVSIQGQCARCMAVSDRLVTIATTAGHWLLSSQRRHKEEPWVEDTSRVVQVLDREVRCDWVGRPASLLLRAAHEDGPHYWFFVSPSADGREEQLHYQILEGPDESLSVGNQLAAARGEGLCPVAAVDGRASGPSLLCARPGSLHCCGPTGSAHSLLPLGHFAADGYRQVEASGTQIRLLWNAEHGGIEFCLVHHPHANVASRVLGLTFQELRAMPVVVGRDIFSLRGDGQLYRWRNILSYQ